MFAGVNLDRRLFLVSTGTDLVKVLEIVVLGPESMMGNDWPISIEDRT